MWPLVNPLVDAGLISQDLADVLATPSSDAAAAKRQTKHIVGARELMANEYSEMLKEDQRKKDQLAKERKERVKRENVKRKRRKKKRN